MMNREVVAKMCAAGRVLAIANTEMQDPRRPPVMRDTGATRLGEHVLYCPECAASLGWEGVCAAMRKFMGEG